MDIKHFELIKPVTYKGFHKRLDNSCKGIMIFPAWLDHLEKGFSSKEFQFKNFCLPVKTSCPLAENI